MYKDDFALDNHQGLNAIKLNLTKTTNGYYYSRAYWTWK